MGKKKLSDRLQTDRENVEPHQLAAHSMLSQWLDHLNTHLLHTKKWDGDMVNEWSRVVTDIHTHWEATTNIKPFPKLHMLTHTVEFAQRHCILGQISESQLESFHFRFNTLLNKHHFNVSKHKPECLRRCLADSVLHSVQPCLD